MHILRLNLISCSIIALGVSACSIVPTHYVPSFVKPYQFDIQQGNLITQQDVAKLQMNMTKEQVRLLLGTPLLNDPFHSNRWDYVYRVLKANGQVIHSQYTIIFNNNLVVHHAGSNLPTEAAALLTTETPNPKLTQTPNQLP